LQSVSHPMRQSFQKFHYEDLKSRTNEICWAVTPVLKAKRHERNGHRQNSFSSDVTLCGSVSRTIICPSCPDSCRYERGNFKFPPRLLGFPPLKIGKFSLYKFDVSETPQTYFHQPTHSQRQDSRTQTCGLSGLQPVRAQAKPCAYQNRI
jgi:hypothetical protein